MTLSQAHRWLAVNTMLGEDVLLLANFSGSETLGRLFQFNLDLRSEKHDVKFEDLIGTNATVRMEIAGDEPRYFNGYISRIVQSEAIGGLAQYQATVVPWAWFLTRIADCRIFQELTVPDIIKEVFRSRGYSNFKDALSRTYPTWEYCVQYRETDFNFVSRLMEQEGIYYFFIHEDGKHTLVLADSSTAHTPVPGYETMRFLPQGQGSNELDRVRDWSFEKELQSGAYAMRDFDFKNPKNDLTVVASKSRPHAASDLEVYDYPGEYDLGSDGEAYARVRIEEIHSQYETAAAGSDVRGAAAGRTFTLADHPRDDQNREYLLVSTSYSAHVDEYGSGGGGGGSGQSFQCSFSAIPADQPYRSQRTTPKPLIQGPQTAIVVGKAGDEITTDEHGRVKVKFPWDRAEEHNEKSSCWIRVAQSWAGKKWGAMFIPRVGQEVIVEFLEGDPDQPIITGRVYNGDSKPPYDLPANATMSTLKSLSSKGGGGFNEIRFEDKKGEEQLFIHAEKNQDIRTKKDVFEFVGNNRHLIVTTDQFEQVKNNRHETVDNDHHEEVKNDRHVKVGGKEALEVTGSRSLTVKGDVIDVFKANHSEQTTGNIYLKGAMIVIEGSTGVTIKCGGNAVVIDSAGVTIKGSMVTVDGQTVMIASGPGSPPGSGSAGSAVAPAAPTAPEEADKADPGEMAEVKSQQKQTQTGKYGAVAAPPYRPPQTEEEKATKTSWIEIVLVDEADKPVAGERYKITLPDGTTVREGSLDDKGFARVDGIEPGTCKVTFPELDKDAWKSA